MNFALDSKFFLPRLQGYRRTHLIIDKLRAERISQEQNRLVLRILSSGCGNIRIDPADLLPFTCCDTTCQNLGRSCLGIMYLLVCPRG